MPRIEELHSGIKLLILFHRIGPVEYIKFEWSYVIIRIHILFTAHIQFTNCFHQIYVLLCVIKPPPPLLYICYNHTTDIKSTS